MFLGFIISFLSHSLNAISNASKNSFLPRTASSMGMYGMNTIGILKLYAPIMTSTFGTCFPFIYPPTPVKYSVSLLLKSSPITFATSSGKRLMTAPLSRERIGLTLFGLLGSRVLVGMVCQVFQRIRILVVQPRLYLLFNLFWRLVARPAGL